MATGGDKNRSRVERERSRVYRARQEFHAGLQTRRRRDNVIAGVAGGILLLAVIGGQVAYYTLGPGTPAPSPTPSATAPSSAPAPDDAPTSIPDQTETPAPTP